MRNYLLLFSLVLAPVFPISFADEHTSNLPSSYRAEYLAKASGLSPKAFRSLERLDEQRFRLTNGLDLTVLGASVSSLTEYSEFVFVDGQLRPLVYSYDQSGVGSRSEIQNFDWDMMRVTGSVDREDTSIDLTDGVHDMLSFTAQLSLDLTQLPAENRIVGQEFVYQIVDEDELDEHRYRIVGAEEIDTPLGKLPTLKLDRIRDAGSRRSTSFWLAVDREFLLVRLEQVSSSGSKTELLLQSIQTR